MPALTGVSHDIPAGTFCGLLGPNGAGKTSLIRILCGWIRPRSGSVLVFGDAAGSAGARSKVGFCPQEVALYPTLTANENLALFGRLAGLERDRLRRRMSEVLDATALSDSANRRVETYSGGMKRRLNLAVALLHEPQLLLLDEPTAGVDPQSRLLLFDCLEALHRRGATLLYSTHRMDEVERICTRVVILDGGRVLAGGATAEVAGGVSLEERFLALTGRRLRDEDRP